MNIDKSNIERVYSGKPGCCCGCRGTYSDKQASITRVYNILMKSIENVVIETHYSHLAYLETENHLYIIYFKEGTK